MSSLPTRRVQIPQVKVKAVYEDKKYFYTVMEACDGGDLLDFFNAIMDENVRPKTREKQVRLGSAGEF